MILGVVLYSFQIRPIAQTNPANSRATAVAATVFGDPSKGTTIGGCTYGAIGYNPNYQRAPGNAGREEDL